jgi:hypothetical protein
MAASVAESSASSGPNPGGGPGREPPRRAQHADQLVVCQLVQPLLPGLFGQPGQHRAWWHLVGCAARTEPWVRLAGRAGFGAGLATGHQHHLFSRQ